MKILILGEPRSAPLGLGRLAPPQAQAQAQASPAAPVAGRLASALGLRGLPSLGTAKS